MKASMDAKGIRVEDLPSDKKERYKYFLSVYVQVMAYQQKKAAAANGGQGQYHPQSQISRSFPNADSSS